MSIADLNFSSARARAERVKLLKDLGNIPELDWGVLLEEFCQRVLHADRDGQPGVYLHTLPKPDRENDNVEIHGSLLEALPERLKALFVCAYHVDTRKGELRKLQWSQVDFEAAQIKLAGRQTKGKKPRTLPIYGDMEAWLLFQYRNRAPDCPWVFYYHGPRLEPISPAGTKHAKWLEFPACCFTTYAAALSAI